MCTVTFIPFKDKFFITSNRDEHISRKAPLRPEVEVVNGKKVVYPKDKTAGGTWFAMNENGVAAVLLNGAFQNHERILPYRKSRGLIVLEIISNENPVNFLEAIHLHNIEPFTLVLFDQKILWEFRWDGSRKHKMPLDSTKSHIWSSWTLYDTEAQNIRNHYFDNFKSKHRTFDGDGILDFHKENHGDFQNGFVIDRHNGLKTLSVTQVVLDKENCKMNHYDLDANQNETISIRSISQTILP